MQRVKKPKKKQITMTQAEIDRLKNKVSYEVTNRVTLLILAAVVDELGTDDEQICNIVKRTNRYADYIKEHYVHMEDIRKTIEKGTGVKMKGWY